MNKEWKPIDHFGDCTIEANNGDRRLVKEGVVVFQYKTEVKDERSTIFF